METVENKYITLAYKLYSIENGANEHQVEESQKAVAKMEVIIGDPDRLRAVAEDFIKHYETRVARTASHRNG